jgi:hypothetical protein
MNGKHFGHDQTTPKLKPQNVGNVQKILQPREVKIIVFKGLQDTNHSKAFRTKRYLSLVLIYLCLY